MNDEDRGSSSGHTIVTVQYVTKQITKNYRREESLN